MYGLLLCRSPGTLSCTAAPLSLFSTWTCLSLTLLLPLFECCHQGLSRPVAVDSTPWFLLSALPDTVCSHSHLEAETNEELPPNVNRVFWGAMHGFPFCPLYILACPHGLHACICFPPLSLPQHAWHTGPQD
ncbi:hypothetical protein EI94DRAFT_635206 [Lactarius quietus]|nr:hypothetical protein EI94DRAFT_635206 [Lactarius quietus]